MARGKKLTKEIVGTVLTIHEISLDKTMVFNFTKLPPEIQAKLGPFGMASKLGDAAAGKEGQTAVDSIMKVWNGLAAGDWSVRAPAGEKVSKKGILEKFAALSDKEKKVAEPLLRQLGLL